MLQYTCLIIMNRMQCLNIYLYFKQLNHYTIKMITLTAIDVNLPIAMKITTLFSSSFCITSPRNQHGNIQRN